ncbi:MAG: hypothetical protein PHD41_00560 [Methanosarcinaceae archaeon]|nr:hypothetical protein [Methanosarcinaceae archaeon]MDD4331135.1 hypothetical protein [Methanosarcinaceae archaeon]MDD4749273.1 hypothetical protein [Methanosarcinaceae archaeon]
MNEIKETDRFECTVINIIKNLAWKGITVEENATKGRVYFARVSGAETLKEGDTLYLGVRPLYDIEDKSMRVTLYDAENNKLDWTLL